MANFSQYYKENGVPYVFDPGQSLPAWTADGLRECIDGATVLIANDYEIGLIANMTGLDEGALAGLAKAVIVTKGEHGSRAAGWRRGHADSRRDAAAGARPHGRGRTRTAAGWSRA